MAQAIRSYSKEDKYKHERLSQLADRIEEIRVLFHLMARKENKKRLQERQLLQRFKNKRLSIDYH